MKPIAPRLATALSALGFAVALASPAHAFLGFGSKPDAAKPAAQQQPAKPEKPKPARKATAAERAAADRLEPLARAAFWGHESELDPTDIPAAVSFSDALRALGRYDEAAQSAQQALVIQPNNVPALLAVARAEIGRNRGFYAIDYLKKVEALDARDWRAPSLEGVALEQSERPSEARDAYARALKLSPNNPSVLANLALSYAQGGDPARAEQMLRTAAAQPAATIQVRQNLALVLGMEGKFAEAERLIRQDLPPEVAGNNLAYLKATTAGPQAPGRTWAGVKSAEAAIQR